MRRILYSVAMSLDGYIAGPNGEIDWIIMDPEIDFGWLMSRFDVVLMGRRTFEAARSMGGGAAMPGVKTVVVSSTLRHQDCPDIEVLSADLERSVRRLREQAGKDIWLFGGGSLFRSLLEMRLVDVVEVAVIPVMLGNGIPLLPPPASRAKLKLVNTKIYQTGIVWLEYAVVS